MLLLSLCFLASFVASLVLTHRVRAWATRLGIVDRPDELRRHHHGPIPRGGGLAIGIAVTSVFFVCAALVPDIQTAIGETSRFAVLIGGGAAIFLIGLIDDVRRLGAWTKLVAECVVAILVFVAGVRIELVTVPGANSVAIPLWLSGVFTVIWMVGITNAFNLIDGSDGVAGGAGLFAALALTAVFLVHDQILGAVLALSLAGALLGFLYFNFPPASIFLGDSGSLFLGYTLAALGVVTTHKANTVLAIAIPVVAFGLPILDTLLAIVRRILKREPIFKADRGHIHHRLRDLGHSPRKVALVMYAACALFAFLSLLLIQPHVGYVTSIFLVACVVLWVGVQRLRIPEFLEMARAIQRSWRQRQAIAENVRIREATAQLHRATDAAEVAGALQHAFSSELFDRVEIWMPSVFGQAFSGTSGVEWNGNSCLWSMGVPRNGLNDRLIEWRLPVVSSPAACRMSLFRSLDREFTFADVRLIATEIQPALAQALTRLAGNATHTREPVTWPKPQQQMDPQPVG